MGEFVNNFTIKLPLISVVKSLCYGNFILTATVYIYIYMCIYVWREVCMSPILVAKAPHYIKLGHSKFLGRQLERS